ncbi:pyridoxamine kinase [Youxingia wuxianensis]|uniref:pyridoxal kinase n=1 Tax=Youxingia wuxianensis TaxID=2763678 RepID=A0A926EKB2_9FIRM|nr:pyridoxamine kinase [Youxingia wuxianensis]MBC8584141.1 pyridoxamine kinase [Youxingia wuxianensis]
MAIPKVAAIHDLSGLGKCSLTSAIPILAAMGVQACPLPTAALSNQTGFQSFSCVDLTDYMSPFAHEWKKQGVQFDGIYTGFLNDLRQVKITEDFIKDFRTPHTLVLIDPVLGDNGHLYPVFDQAMSQRIKQLIRYGDIITPNLTEACLLTDSDYKIYSSFTDISPFWHLAQQLAEIGPKIVVISGIHQGANICNLAYDARDNSRFIVKNRRIGANFSGTGDILAAILCGGLVRKQPLKTILEKAALLLEKAVDETCTEQTDPNEGIAFENYLYLLMGKELSI